ncbi:hypothetical protein [Microbulbifer discodermiae]|uniref:hypothetical protein n=1 Tax=Microbulbifer sp. 2201CG32-9 TaxID=3232309 RepID=UPI00345B6810
MKCLQRILKNIRGVNLPVVGGGISWQPSQIEELEVDINFPTKSGLKNKLEDEGYDVRWSSSKKLQTRIHNEGWEKVVWKNAKGDKFHLKSTDGLLIRLKR